VTCMMLGEVFSSSSTTKSVVTCATAARQHKNRGNFSFVSSGACNYMLNRG
jgi:hypothetical protein